MFPLFTSIDKDIYANIMSSGKGLNPLGNTVIPSTELMPFVRLISGTGDGLIMQSNPDVPIISDVATPTFDKNNNVISVKSTPSAYGNKYQSGFLGYNWKMEPVYPFNTPFTGDLVLRPSPIITDLEVKEGKDQISRTAKVVIKCFSLAQAEKMQEYVMEPGHSLLIEYGWNSDRASSQLIQLTDPNNNNSPLSSELISINVATTNLNQTNLMSKRIKSLGDYDSFFGFIVGGQMTSEGDVYVLSIDLRGMPGLPSYLQLHQNINQITETTDSTGKVTSRKVTGLPEAPLYTQSEINNNTYTLQNMGERRWKWMFNKLPATRQTFEVQKIINSIQNPNTNVGWWDLINFDYKIADEIVKFTTDDIWDSVKQYVGIEPEFQQDGVKIPKERLLSENRFIRFEKALEILNRNNGLVSYKVGNKDVKVRIATRGFIGAFPKIFSTKPSKLIIPGKIPDFQSYYLNTSAIDTNGIIDSEIDNSINVSFTKSQAPVAKASFNSVPFLFNPYTPSSITQQSTYHEGNAVITERISFVQYSSDGKGLKPAPIDPKDPGKGNYLGYYENDGYYGELGNLYLNFGLFLDVLRNSSNKSIREVLMDLLNEMSSAVNSFWNFQLIEGTDANGDYILRIVDENWSGRNESVVRNFVHSGEKSVFLDATLSVDIPSETTNQIILKRQDYISNPEAKSINVGGIFSANSDKFFKGVDYVKSAAVGSTSGTKKATSKLTAADIKIEIEAIKDKVPNKDYKDNFKTDITTLTAKDAKGDVVYVETVAAGVRKIDFTTYGNVSPNTNNATGQLLSQKIAEYRQALKDEADAKSSNLNANLAKIEVLPNPEIFSIDTSAFDIATRGVAAFRQNFRIYTCDDTQLFDVIKNNAYESYGLTQPKATSHLLPIKYSFKILGRSGIKRGDIFNVYGIPKKYRDWGFFQVTEVEHSFTDNKWTTEITGQFRQQKQD